jgi:hypothetical protein
MQGASSAGPCAFGGCSRKTDDNYCVTVNDMQWKVLVGLAQMPVRRDAAGLEYSVKISEDQRR